MVSHTHTAGGKPTLTEVTEYTYDHAERLTKVEHTLGGVTVTLVENTYDELGRLQSMSPHGNASQKLTYAYNLRDWLTGISGSKFSQNLYYNTGNGTPCYNGNISGMTWQAGNETTTRGYKFTYDGLNRLLDAVYGEGTNIGTNAGRFTEKVTSYDKNGNILGLHRYGQTGASSYGLIDNLTFTLEGNQLNRVDDAAGTAAYNGSFEFKDAVKQANEYAYDANGNLTKDLNRNISNIQYNFLNLPSKVTFGDGSTIEYVYAADGTKLRTKHVINGTTTTTDYCGNVVYENGVQKLLLTEAGYVTLSDRKYHYYLQDHQGNNRVVLNQNGTVEEVNHYYPFGGLFASSTNVQPYKYNGKELDTKNGLNWYDYGARHYDPALGRFTTVDPSSESYNETSPYAYCGNNPVVRIDPTGADWIQDRYGSFLWDNSATNQETTRNGWTYVGTELPEGTDRYRILEEINGNLYHKNTSNPFAALVNWIAGKDIFVEKQAYNPTEDHMMQQFAETGGEMVVGAAAGKAIGLISKSLKGAGVGFNTFNEFKKVYGLAGDGMAWHHIVEQNADNIARFGAKKIHNTNNLIKLPHGKGSIHAKVSGFYNSKIPDKNILVRDYVKTLNFEEQYKFGIETLKRFGWKP